MKIGAQLYTLRVYAQNEIDFGRTLEKVAAIGYRYVQISGVAAVDPKRIKALCDTNGLKIVLTHNPESEFLYHIDDLIEKHQMYGCRFIGLGAMAERYQSVEWVDNFAKDFIGPAQKIKDAGMLFMYHNHCFDFSRLPDGYTIMDHLLNQMPPELMGITADTYWLQYAGIDVVQWLKMHANRLPCVHLKDMAPYHFEARMAALGQGNMNFPAILETLRNNGVTEYALVEQDECYGESPFFCLKQSFDYLANLGY